MQLTALGDSFCSKESGSDYWSVSIISEMQNQQMPWLSGLQVVSVEEVGGLYEDPKQKLTMFHRIVLSLFY